MIWFSSVHIDLAQIELWELQIKTSLEHFGIFDNVGVYFYVFMYIIGKDTTRFGVKIKGRDHIYRQILHKNNKTNKLYTYCYIFNNRL